MRRNVEEIISLISQLTTKIEDQTGLDTNSLMNSYYPEDANPKTKRMILDEKQRVERELEEAYSKAKGVTSFEI